MWGLDSTVTYKKECVITRVYTCIPLLVHVYFRCVSHATHWNCCFAQEARFKKVVSIPRYHQSSALIQLLNSRCWFLSHDSFWTTGWLELASLIRRRRKFYYIRGCGVFVKNICCWNIWKWGSEQWAENAQLTSIRAVGDTLSPFYLTYTEVASENLYLGLHTACIMIHIFSASALQRVATASVWKFNISSVSVSSNWQYWHWQIRHLDVWIVTSGLQTFCGAMVGNAMQMIGMLDHRKCNPMTLLRAIIRNWIM